MSGHLRDESWIALGFRALPTGFEPVSFALKERHPRPLDDSNIEEAVDGIRTRVTQVEGLVSWTTRRPLLVEYIEVPREGLEPSPVGLKDRHSAVELPGIIGVFYPLFNNDIV